MCHSQHKGFYFQILSFPNLMTFENIRNGNCVNCLMFCMYFYYRQGRIDSIDLEFKFINQVVAINKPVSTFQMIHLLDGLKVLDNEYFGVIKHFQFTKLFNESRHCVT